MGLGGEKAKAWCKKKVNSGPAQEDFIFNLRTMFEQPSTRFVSPNSWPFKQNS